MSDQIPSQSEEAICRCKALYLGTSIFSSEKKNFNESGFNIAFLQESIGQRYPVDGSNFARGIQTCLSVYPSGIQMEHSSIRNSTAISALFFYPIKSLVYCGALRFVEQDQTPKGNSKKSWMFVPLDTPTAQNNKNIKYPPLFVSFVRGVDPSTKRQIFECHVFVVGMVKTAMNLVESCQKAFNNSKVTVSEFYKKYGNVPVVFCMKDDLSNTNDSANDSRKVVKSFDLNGYHYATDQTPIDLWQLFEDDGYINVNGMDSIIDEKKKKKKTIELTRSENEIPINDLKFKQNIPTINGHKISNSFNQNHATSISAKSSQVINPYSKTDNLVTVEKRVDPITGQNLYVRYMNSDKGLNPQLSKLIKGYDESKDQYSLHDLIYGNHFDVDEECSNAFKNQDIPPIIIRQEKTPSPIIVEKYIKKKSPQVIIKEIHVQEPAPPPIKVVEKMDGSQAPADIFYNEKLSSIYQSQLSSQSKECIDGSNFKIQNSIMKTGVQTSEQPITNRFRNMICHTTYETLRGEPVTAEPLPQFCSQVDPNKCVAYNSSNIIRRPLVKDINFYLNKAENQLLRQQQSYVSNRTSSQPIDANNYTLQRRFKSTNNSDGRRKTYIDNFNIESRLSTKAHFEKQDEINLNNSKPCSDTQLRQAAKPITKIQSTLSSEMQNHHQLPKSILSKKQGTSFSKRGEMSNNSDHRTLYRVFKNQDKISY